MECEIRTLKVEYDPKNVPMLVTCDWRSTVIVDRPIVPLRNVCMPAALVDIGRVVTMAGNEERKKAEGKKCGRSNKHERRRIAPQT
jgi:hypothetical protein